MINDILHSLKIKGTCKNITTHRHNVLYDIELQPGQSIKRIENHLREIGLALKSYSTPTLTTVSQKGIVRIQITNKAPTTITFDELYEKNLHTKPKSLLPFLIGEEGSGAPVWIDISTCPHMLVAGATGSGKSVFLHTLIANVNKRDDVRLYLSDPKHVEFIKYKNLANIIDNTYVGTLKTLKYLAYEMEDRYEQFSELQIKNINESPYVVPKILLIIDEVADLMLQDKDKKNPNRGQFEQLLVKIAQKSRAVGIHIVLATQRPSVDILTGLIKANFPARVACKVSSATDSKVIIDQSGAENLIGRGDAILKADGFDWTRFQVAFAN